MAWFFGSERQIKGAVESVFQAALSEAGGRLKDVLKADELRREISRLEIERDKKHEEFSRREREVEHKVGLERKRQEFEISQAKRETEVKVREENLALDKDRFKQEMEFQRQRLEGEVQSLREMVGQMLKRLPSAEIYAEVKAKR